MVKSVLPRKNLPDTSPVQPETQVIKRTDSEVNTGESIAETQQRQYQALVEWEKHCDVIDRYQLLAFGLRRRHALLRRILFLKAVA